MKTQCEQVDCKAQSGLYHSRPASIRSYTNELNTNRPKQTEKTQTKTPKTHTTQTNIYQSEHIVSEMTYNVSMGTLNPTIPYQSEHNKN